MRRSGPCDNRFGWPELASIGTGLSSRESISAWRTLRLALATSGAIDVARGVAAVVFG